MTWLPGDPIHDPYGDTCAEPLLAVKGDHCLCWKGRRSPSWCVDHSPDVATWPLPDRACHDLEEVG